MDLPQTPETNVGRRIQEIEENVNEAAIEFSAVVYAVLEKEQKVELSVKRTGPIDVDNRFRCLAIARRSLSFSLYFYISLTHASFYLRSILMLNTDFSCSNCLYKNLDQT